MKGLRLIGLAAWRGVGELYNSEGLTHAASIAYYALLSLFPFLLLILSILGSVTSDPGDRDTVVRFIFRYFPRQFDFMTGQLDAFRGQTVRLAHSRSSNAGYDAIPRAAVSPNGRFALFDASAWNSLSVPRLKASETPARYAT